MKKLSFLGIVLISFTSLPVLPSTYRPVTVLLLLLPGFLYAYNLFNRDELYDKLLLIFTIFLGVYSFILCDIFEFSYINLLKNFAVFILGVLSYFGFNYAFENLEFAQLFKAFRMLVNVFIIIATLDLLLFLSGDLFGLRTILFNFIADKIGGRPQYTTSEPAWASQITLFLVPIQSWISSRKKKKVEEYKVFYLYLLIILTFSLLGYVLLITYLVIVYIYKNKNKFRAIAEVGFLVSFTITAIVGSLFYFSSPDNYTLNRIKNIYNEAELTDIYNIDASAYIRTLYPKVGYDIFVDYPLGIGVGGYSYMFGDYIVKYDYQMLYNAETQRNIEEKNTDPKNLYAKILSEFGFVNGGFFILLIFLICRKREKGYKYDRRVRNLIFSMNVVTALVFLQFSSLAYIPFWFCVALNKNYNVLTDSYRVYLAHE